MTTILAINPGSTSTKIAVFQDDDQIAIKNIRHAAEELRPFSRVQDQFSFRREVVEQFLADSGVSLDSLDAVVGRGTILPPVASGAYEVNDDMIDYIQNSMPMEHASCLGALIAHDIACRVGIKAYIYDPVSVDEMTPVAKLTGIKGVRRPSYAHVLNMRAAAVECARKLSKPYDSLALIVAHLGSGITMSLHEKGRMADIVSDDEGPFSPERAGRVPGVTLLKYIQKQRADFAACQRQLRGASGLISHLGTPDLQQVQALADKGDEYAALVFEAMAYQVAKGIGELATIVCGRVDQIVLTGGCAYSERLTEKISRRVSFIAPVMLLPGEDELRALALGILRVLRGQEKAKTFTID